MTEPSRGGASREPSNVGPREVGARPRARGGSLRGAWALPTLPFFLGCLLVAPFEEAVEVEERRADCEDGEDNDLDGFADCEDPSCGCNACDGGTWTTPAPSDDLGSVCTRSCECRLQALRPGTPAESNFRWCNPRAQIGPGSVEGRCMGFDALDAAGEPFVEENRFSVRFAIEQDERGESDLLTARQSVVGRARFQGQRFEFSQALWTLRGRKLEFRSAGTGDLVLEAVLETRDPSVEREVFALLDGLEARENDAVRAQLGPITEGLAGGVNQVAIVESSTLAIERAQVGDRIVARGRWSGTFRAPAAVDRTLGGRCGADRIYHPDPQRCFPAAFLSSLNAFFAFGCVLGDVVPARSGLAAFWWENPWSPAEFRSLSGECAARATEDGVEVRIRSAATQSVGFVLRATIPFGILAPGTTVEVGTAGLSVDVHRARGRGPVLEEALPPVPEARIVGGRLAVEQVNFGVPPRLFGWVEGVVATTE